jgi:hypothetical protein
VRLATVGVRSLSEAAALGHAFRAPNVISPSRLTAFLRKLVGFGDASKTDGKVNPGDEKAKDSYQRLLNIHFQSRVFLVDLYRVTSLHSPFGGSMPKKAIRLDASHSEAAATAPSHTEAKIEGFAEDLGRLLGTAKAKAEHWIGQRQAIAKHLDEIRTTASHLLSQLGGVSTMEVPLPRRRSPAVASVGNRAPGRTPQKKWTMSAEAREKIAAAQRARWAKQKAGAKKV